MRTRIVLSVLAILAYMGAGRIYQMVESPVVGTANAQQMTDTVTGYATHQAVSSGIVTDVMLYSFLAVMALIWITALWRKSSPPCDKNNTRCCNH